MFSFAWLGVINDAVNWLEAAALVVAIAVAGVLLLAGLVVGHFPMLRWSPYARPARLVAFLAFGALCALMTLQLVGDRCDAQRAADRQAAEEARVDRDDGISKLLKDKYGPQLKQLEKLNADLRRKVADNAKRKPGVSAGGSCRLGDAARRLQAP